KEHEDKNSKTTNLLVRPATLPSDIPNPKLVNRSTFPLPVANPEVHHRSRFASVRRYLRMDSGSCKRKKRKQSHYFHNA
ncbi:MAG: hypothetical protein ACK4GC_08235, partial [Paracoccaceae bacterium]